MNSRDLSSLSLWHDTVVSSLDPRPGLSGDRDADVVIVGAGFTGLWTAYYLHQADPGLRIVLLESVIAGFGASGRNGGWLSALFPVGPATLAKESGHEAAVAQYRAMIDTVGEVVTIAEREGIDADIAVGGTVRLARSRAQLQRAEAEVAEAAEFGLGIDLLDGAAASERLNASGVVGGTFTRHCAAIHPAKLARGLAEVISRSADLYEGTRVTAIEPGIARTAKGNVRADVIVRATEGYTAELAGAHRDLVPIYSLIIATEPLSEAVWEQIGLQQRETWSDFRHLIIYGQRSADNRMVFGGRGAPYHFGSSIRPGFDQVPKVFAALQRTLIELFPILADVVITHRWGGPLGVTRDWHASVGLERDTGLAWAGGYVGDGVSTTNLAGRTLADLITRRDSPLTSLPWVGHRSRRWEPEPLRWIGANVGLQAMSWADAAERRTGRTSRVAEVVDRVLGR